MKRFPLLVAAAALMMAACSSDVTSSSSATGGTAPGEQDNTDIGAGTTTTSQTEGGIATVPVDLEPTPAQTEGPYYPIEKLDDQDGDLTEVAGAPGTPQGTVLLIDGKLLTAEGQPISGATIEIWQTDANGIYQHPGDPKTNDRDPNFQFYGESVTDANGAWSFRTIDPGYYEPRPRHIHVKVRVDGKEALTTQIYFEGDERLAGESIDEALIAATKAGEENGTPVLTAIHDLVVDL